MPETLVVNFFAGPGAGKTTCAWEVAAELKKKNIVTEYVPEYAKELVWDNRRDLLDGSYKNQLHVLHEQAHRIDRLLGKVDVVVTDSPVLLQPAYCKENQSEFEQQALNIFSSRNNFNLFINRGSHYEQAGRLHTLEESRTVDGEVKDILSRNNIYYGTYSHSTIDVVVENIQKTLNKLNENERGLEMPYDKQAYAEQMKIRTKELSETLVSGMQEFHNSDKYKAYLNAMSHLYDYSPKNIMLIHKQMPNATMIANFNTWKHDFKRHIKKGETGLYIYAPAKSKEPEKVMMEKLDPATGAPLLDNDGKVVMEEMTPLSALNPVKFVLVPVFDVSQTGGEPLPELIEDITGNVAHYEAFVDALKEVSTLPIEFKPLPDSRDGECEYGVKISIRENMSEAQTVSAIVHEMTHDRLHDKNKLPENAEPKKKQVREIEAESISYVVCQHYGIETSPNSFGYLSEYGSRDMKEILASLSTIRKESASLITAIDEKFNAICKERGIDLAAKEPEQAATPPEQAEPSYSTESRTENIAGIDFEFNDVVPDTAKTAETTVTAAQDTPAANIPPPEVKQFAADFYSYMLTAYHNGLPPLSQKDIDISVSEIAASMSGGNIDELKGALQGAVHNTAYPEQAAALLKRLENIYPDSTVSQNATEYELPDIIMPDPSIGFSEMNLYGYAGADMLPLTEYTAAMLFECDLTIYMLNSDNTEAMVFDTGEITQHDGIFGVERGEWLNSEMYGRLENQNVTAAMSGEVDYKERPDPSMVVAERLAQDIDNFLHDYDQKSYLSSGMTFDESLAMVEGAIKDGGEYVNNLRDYLQDAAGNEQYGEQATDLLNRLNEISPPVTFSFYQLKDIEETRYHRFASIKQLEADNLSVDRSNYELAYTAPLPTKETLENLFAKFNEAHPIDYTGRSMSVSDVIVIERVGETSAHYVDNFGFAEVPTFLTAQNEQSRSVPAAVGGDTDDKETPIPPPEPHKSEIPIYKFPVEHAKESGELDAWRESGKINAECGQAIDKAVNDSNYEQYRYDLKGAVKSVIEEYGADRVAWVLAANVNYHNWDGRLSTSNKDWAKGYDTPKPDFYLNTHLTIVDGLVNRFREAEKEKPSLLDSLNKTEQKIKNEGRKPVAAAVDGKEKSKKSNKEDI